jgi:hypothetical protein
VQGLEGAWHRCLRTLVPAFDGRINKSRISGLFHLEDNGKVSGIVIIILNIFSSDVRLKLAKHLTLLRTSGELAKVPKERILTILLLITNVNL